MSSRRGPDLPYSVIAGVTPWRLHWLVASAKLHGATFAPEEPRIFDSFVGILDERPSYSAIVVNAPIGYLDSPATGARTCDRDARALLGQRGKFVHNAPTWPMLHGDSPWTEGSLDAISAMLLPCYREVAAEMSPYLQRLVYEGNPELSFYQLNGDVPLHRSKKIEGGRDERRVILEEKVPGISRVLDAELDGVPRKHLFDAAALLWTARRVFARAAMRLPVDPEWDSQGLRMELVF